MSDVHSTYQPNKWMTYSPVTSHPTPYEILMRQSRLLGKVATAALDKTKNAVVEVGRMSRRQAREEQQFYQDNPDEMHQVVAQSQEILAGAKTVILPYNIFPDRVTLGRMKVTIDLWRTLWSHEIVTLRIEDILNVSARTGLLFGALTISTRIMNSTDHFVIQGFWNKDALRLKHIIQGYMIALHQGIHVSDLSTERLIRKLNELGDDPSAIK